MTHSHEHHSHDHGDPHHEHHPHDHGDPHHEHRAVNLSFDQKLVKRIEHWIAHNAEHAATYREWAGQTTGKGLPAVAALLEKAARTTDEISRMLEEALDKVPAGKEG